MPDGNQVGCKSGIGSLAESFWTKNMFLAPMHSEWEGETFILETPGKSTSTYCTVLTYVS